MFSQSEIELTTLSIRRTPVSAGSELTAAQLVVLLGPAVGQSLLIGDAVMLGRATPGLTIHDDGVSRRHASITRTADGAYLLRDQGSRNGTYVNGVRVDEVLLAVGDRIAIGGQTVLQLVLRDRLDDQRAAAQKLQTLGELAAGIAHDFNNLLGVVLTNVSHVQSMSTWREEDVRRVLADIEVAARRADQLTHDLMAFAHNGPRARDVMDVGVVIEGAARLLARALPENIQIEVQAEPGLVVLGDLARLTQALGHVGVNAIAAMPAGGRLLITAKRCGVLPPELAEEQFLLPAGELVQVTISDSGIGMHPDVRRRAFDPFFTTKARGAGTGLGLATALVIARDHGGDMGLVSAPDRGTSVFLFLPLRAGRPQPDARTTKELSSRLGCVLLADDEALVRGAAKRVLEHAGFTVLVASDGAEAVEVFAAHAQRIDLVLLDLDMPNLDGEQAFAAIRAIAPGVRVLISSGYVERAREDKLRAAGIDGTLDKPYDSATLVRAVTSAMREASRAPQP